MLQKYSYGDIVYIILSILAILFLISSLKDSIVEKHIINNGKTVYAVITKRYCGFKNNLLKVRYKEIEDNIFITRNSCLSETSAEGNLYPVKYLEGEKQLVATWENSDFLLYIIIIGLIFFSISLFWFVFAFILSLFPNKLHKLRVIYLKINYPFNH